MYMNNTYVLYLLINILNVYNLYELYVIILKKIFHIKRNYKIEM